MPANNNKWDGMGPCCPCNAWGQQGERGGGVGVCQRANKLTSSTTATVVQCSPVPEPHVPLSRRLDFIKSSENANFSKSAALAEDAIARCEGKGL